MPRRQTPENPKIDAAIDKLLSDIVDASPYDETIDERVKQVETLHNVKHAIQGEPNRVSADTVLIVLGNVLVAVMIIAFERENVVTTKVTSFLSKPR